MLWMHGKFQYLAIQQLRQSTFKACWKNISQAFVRSETSVVQKFEICSEIIVFEII